MASHITLHLTRFLAWWSAELRALMPARLRTPATAANMLLLDVGRQTVRVVDEAQTQDEAEEHEPLAEWPRADPEAAPPAAHWLGTHKPEETTVRVRPREGLGLSREVVLPMAAEENLEQVVGFEMERLTPFRAADVYYHFRLERRDTQKRQLVLSLVVAPRSVVDPVLGVLSAWELKPQVQAGAAFDGDLDLMFRPARFRERRPGRMKTWLVVVNLLLAAALVSVPIYRQKVTLAALHERLDGLRVTAAKVNDVRDRIAAVRSGGEYLLAQRASRPPLVLLVEEVSTILPDDTWLNRLETRDLNVNLHGTSSAASALISLISGSTRLTDARFASPVLREGGSGRDRFHVTATIRPAGDEP